MTSSSCQEYEATLHDGFVAARTPAGPQSTDGLFYFLVFGGSMKQ